MHASRGMNEKWLIMYPKMNETVRLTLTLFPTPLGGLSFFIFLRWLLYSDIVISIIYVHFHHRFFIAYVLFNVGVFVSCMLPLPYSPNCSLFFILRVFLRDHYDVAVDLTFIFDRPKLSLIVQWETIWGTKAGGWPPCPNEGNMEEKS